MTTPAIEFRDVSITYRLAERGMTFKEWVIRSLHGGISWHNVHALSKVSFQLLPGETLGVIGGNGAGKSTLLRVAGGILSPTSGEATMRGRLAPIIELGTGFEMELSGRENIFFNGALLGRSRAEMQSRLDDIIDFAGIGSFIDAPLRTYSTGMVARLAFAVATTVEAHILLLDEILSVGDQTFRERCHRRIEEFRSHGVSILLVSHDLSAIRSLCTKTMWLEHGRLRALGPTTEVAAAYEAAAAAEPCTSPGPNS